MKLSMLRQNMNVNVKCVQMNEAKCRVFFVANQLPIEVVLLANALCVCECVCVRLYVRV